MSRNKNNTLQVKKSKNNVSHQHEEITQVQARQYSGPIPHPEILRGFDEIVPGAAERILTMAEENGKHQREIEKLHLTSAYNTIRRGQIFGLLIGILAFATCIIALYLGSESTAMTIGGFTITGLVTVFVTNKFRKTNNSNNSIN
ncbi:MULTISPECIES: DUF2335 domain-containing protein [Nitrosomonas]|uniref:Putative membrane protein n=1 Tax=Nitrosomonas communis TaxID=44574 RepID=A0A1H2YJN9_9PROT|nr:MULTISPECIES: DUF2335 domain-containing protein [Nitrosomonas]TYP82752.1 putative membrane protein [Nitrosomonas communis]UVS61957.1 DUF2335 domain-containing protein [Nitrosomonas sp. PLL12]SDX05376.1 Uncharacterized membrane protein [Nitrosomonas communis]